MDSKHIMLGGGTSWKLQPCSSAMGGCLGSDLAIGGSSTNHKNKEIVGPTDMDWKSNGKEPVEPDDPTLYMSNQEYNNNGVDDDMEDYAFEEDEDYDYGFDADVIDSDEFIVAKFDGMDLPPGVEASVPWLKDSELEPQVPNESKPRNEVDHIIERKFRQFKQFDTVEGSSDHHFDNKSSTNKKPSKEWVKKVQQDWKLLEKDLPDTIVVRAYEDRMDLLRAVIVGPAGTPYHDGLFFFDIHFPPDYPYSPPKAHYHSGGLRINPNLYECGKVCLSLLNTWHGSGCEKWTKNSTMLQVLLSIQALVLNEKPYFNEPGWAPTANTPPGEQQSFFYNETTFILSCKTMLYSLRNPPLHFEDFVAGHFRERGRTILLACKAYMSGSVVGSKIPEPKDEEETEEDETEEVGVSDPVPPPPVRVVFSGTCTVSSPAFRASLAKLYEELLMEFTVKGADTDTFLAEKRKEKQRQQQQQSASGSCAGEVYGT